MKAKQGFNVSWDFACKRLTIRLLRHKSIWAVSLQKQGHRFFSIRKLLKYANDLLREALMKKIP